MFLNVIENTCSNIILLYYFIIVDIIYTNININLNKTMKNKTMKNKTMKNKNKNKNTNLNMKRPTKYNPVNYSYLLGGKVHGIDDKLMKIHFTLYEGLVGATNKALEDMNMYSKNGIKDMVIYSSLQKQFSFFFNGMRLHEMYFGSMCGENMTMVNSDFLKDIEDNFGSFEKWKKHFMATGTIPGVGFVSLIRDRITGKLMNTWINEFNIGELVNTDLIMVMDQWEHAYIAEFGLDIKKYQETYLKNINWSVISENWIKSQRASSLHFGL